MTLTLAYDIDLQPPRAMVMQNSRSTVSRFRRESGDKRTDGQTDRRSAAIALPAALMRPVITKLDILTFRQIRVKYQSIRPTTFDISGILRHLVGVVEDLHRQRVRVVAHTELAGNRCREISTVVKHQQTRHSHRQQKVGEDRSSGSRDMLADRHTQYTHRQIDRNTPLPYRRG